jgi:hypothetical protein
MVEQAERLWPVLRASPAYQEFVELMRGEQEYPQRDSNPRSPP